MTYSDPRNYDGCPTKAESPHPYQVLTISV